MLENALDYEGLKYYDGKSKDYIDEKVSGLQTQVNKKVDKVDGKGLSTNDYTTTEKTKLNGIATGAEVNQNAFSNVVVGSTTISADSKTDSLTLVAGSNVTITPDATNDKVTIAATDTVYTHPASGVTAGTYRSVTVDANGHVTAGTNPTTTVAQGGTGATTLTSGQALIGNGTNAVTTRAINTLSAVGNIGYGSSNANNLATLSTLAFWNGQYTSSKSNLAYCNKGAFGDAAIKGVDTTPTDGSGNLITSNAVYDGLSKKPETILELCKHTPYSGDISTLSVDMYVYHNGNVYAAKSDNAVSGGFSGWCRLLSIDTDTGFCNISTSYYPYGTYIKASKIQYILSFEESKNIEILSQLWLGTSNPSYKGRGDKYGIVKLNDSYTYSAGTAAASVGASSKAVADLYNYMLNSFIKTYTVDIMLSSQTWETSTYGKYYTHIDITELGINKILGVNIANWSGHKTTDIISVGCPNNTDLLISSNVNSFASTIQSKITVSISYI